MIRTALILWLALPAVGADLVSHSRAGNRILLRLGDGAADLEWLSASSFRFRRVWSGPLAGSSDRPAVSFSIEEEPAALLIATEQVRVRVTRRGVLLNVTSAAGAPLLVDAAEAVRRTGEIALDREMRAGERFYGLGPRTDSTMDARGLRIEPSRPFLIAAAGYGEYHAAPGAYTFDLTGETRGRYRVTLRGSNRLDFYFYYGPNPKDIFEEHLLAHRAIPPLSPNRLRPINRANLPAGAWVAPATKKLADYVASIVHASMTAALLPVFDAGLFDGPEAERAMQLAAVAPLLMGAKRDERLIPYLLTYAEEAKDRGFPVIRPLPMQFPRDPNVHCCADEFMLGDELLIAPILSQTASRRVYLPMGVWTDWRSNRVYKGRQTVEISAAPDELPMFVRNGAILPLAQPDGSMHLHYFPRLGAEFFIFEYDAGDYTQVHAAPAAADLRLEIESKRSRQYRWIVHHLDKPSRLESGSRTYEEVPAADRLRVGAWYWDAAQRNLLVHTFAAEDADHILNVSF